MQDDLAEAVGRYTEAQAGSSPFATAVPGLTLLRSDHTKRPSHLIFKPALCIVVQGAKWAIFGNKRLDYRAGQALVVSLEMPALSAVAEASRAEPYLGAIVEFDLGVMREVAGSLPQISAGEKGNGKDNGKENSERGRGVFVTNFDGPLADCALRLVRLLEMPQAIPVLYPAVMREICYWLLSGPQGGEILQMTIASSHPRCILSAIHSLRDRFSEPIRVEELASAVQMSPSAFSRQFKSMTSLTPLQYQKQLRLIEARRLMVADEANVEAAAFQVGYESSSQFSREYSRFFGMPPRRDVASLRNAAA